MMLLIDPENGDIVDANPAAISFYGWSHEEITRKKITNINVLTEEKVFQEMKRAKNEQRRHFYFKHRLSNGDIRDVEVYSGPIILHGKKFLYSIIHDITERKQMEDALKISNKKLTKEYIHRKILSKRLIDLREQDRFKIAMELHDHLGQILPR